jgi:hypothetical protein
MMNYGNALPMIRTNLGSAPIHALISRIPIVTSRYGKYRDVSHYRERVAELDEEFKNSIPEAVKNQTYFPSDDEYTPKEYWWAHLEEVYGIPDPGPDDTI